MPEDSPYSGSDADRHAASERAVDAASPLLTFAFCTYNRADRLERLVEAMRAQSCPIRFEILAINNNSRDDTVAVLGRLATAPGAPLRFVTEHEQGIVPARNRAIAEALGSDMLVFIDDDELPEPGLLDAAHDAIGNEGADCVGGRIKIDFSTYARPDWLDDDVAGFLGALNHSDQAFWIENTSTPVWSGNVGYNMRLFREDDSLRFDPRYNRAGEGVGGGSDAMMFRTLLARGARIRYRPDMTILHSVDPWKLRRSYFLKLHYRAGLREGQFRLPTYPRTVLGIPPFLASQFLLQSWRALRMQLHGGGTALRQAMNAAHTLGNIVGYRRRSSAPAA